MARGIELHLYDVKLALSFVKLLSKTVYLVLFCIELNPVATLDVFLDFHAHDVGIDGQSHLVRHRVDLSLLLLNRSSHVIESLLHG